MGKASKEGREGGKEVQKGEREGDQGRKLKGNKKARERIRKGDSKGKKNERSKIGMEEEEEEQKNT